MAHSLVFDKPGQRCGGCGIPHYVTLKFEEPPTVAEAEQQPNLLFESRPEILRILKQVVPGYITNENAQAIVAEMQAERPDEYTALISGMIHGFGLVEHTKTHEVMIIVMLRCVTVVLARMGYAESGAEMVEVIITIPVSALPGAEFGGYPDFPGSGKLFDPGGRDDDEPHYMM